MCIFVYISFSLLTFSSSGSHVSKVKDRTLEKCTPRLLQRKEALKKTQQHGDKVESVCKFMVMTALITKTKSIDNVV